MKLSLLFIQNNWTLTVTPRGQGRMQEFVRERRLNVFHVSNKSRSEGRY